ncbi:MAG TPA: helix-turn-helix domain-containing protein [Thermoanaerobaculia bacterium]|nr:helix-turn-helix domain-containing protein [Thermoanaerobaculia bacterium]
MPRATELAQRHDLTPVQLERVFRTHVGAKIGEYLKERQIDVAKTLLETTTLSTAVIAIHAGFGTPRSFFRAFRRTTGITPGDYRLKKMSLAQAPLPS